LELIICPLHSTMIGCCVILLKRTAARQLFSFIVEWFSLLNLMWVDDGGITSAAVGVRGRLIPLFGAHNMPVAFDNDWLLCHSS
jgi:hypothetical protein